MENTTFLISSKVHPRREEMDFRRESGLCLNCGLAWRENKQILCAECLEEAEIEIMRQNWKLWGIAA